LPFRFDDFPRPVRVLLPEWINFHFVERQVVIETESVVGNTVFARHRPLRRARQGIPDRAQKIFPVWSKK
jgi:hypothetical protein